MQQDFAPVHVFAFNAARPCAAGANTLQHRVALCGAQYGGVPALSRKYPNTYICPDAMSEGCPQRRGMDATPPKGSPVTAAHGRHSTPSINNPRNRLSLISFAANDESKIESGIKYQL